MDTLLATIVINWMNLPLRLSFHMSVLPLWPSVWRQVQIIQFHVENICLFFFQIRIEIFSKCALINIIVIILITIFDSLCIHLLLIQFNRLSVLFFYFILRQINFWYVYLWDLCFTTFFFCPLGHFFIFRLLFNQILAYLLVHWTTLNPKFWFATYACNQPIEKVIKSHSFEIVFWIYSNFNQISLQFVNWNAGTFKLRKLHHYQLI